MLLFNNSGLLEPGYTLIVIQPKATFELYFSPGFLGMNSTDKYKIIKSFIDLVFAREIAIVLNYKPMARWRVLAKTTLSTTTRRAFLCRGLRFSWREWPHWLTRKAEAKIIRARSTWM